MVYSSTRTQSGRTQQWVFCSHVIPSGAGQHMDTRVDRCEGACVRVPHAFSASVSVVLSIMHLLTLGLAPEPWLSLAIKYASTSQAEVSVPSQFR